MSYYKSKNKSTFSHTITVRCTENQKNSWQEAAALKEMTLNQYIRIAANQLVNKETAKI